MDDDKASLSLRKLRKLRKEARKRQRSGSDGELVCGPDSAAAKPLKKKTRVAPSTALASMRTRVPPSTDLVMTRTRVAPSTDLARRVGPLTNGIVLACTPNMPRRYGCLLSNISFLLCCDNQGYAFECTSDKIDVFLRWSESRICLFFEWVEKDQKMKCQMLTPMAGVRVSFLVNPAFTSQLFEEKIRCMALSFSSNFCCDDTWAAVKNTLQAVFSPQQEDAVETANHLYLFTRIDDSVYIRVMKVDTIPARAGATELVMSEIGQAFCLKLQDVKYFNGHNAVSDGVSDVSQNQKLKLVMSPTTYHSMSQGGLGPCVPHSVTFGNQHYIFLLETGMILSEFEGFTISLLDFLEKEPFLKIKRIIGSKKKDSIFLRNIGKSIIKSMLQELIRLFYAGKCVRMEGQCISHSNVLLNGSCVKLYGVQLVKYEENQAIENVEEIVDLIRQCFPLADIPSDLDDMLFFLLEDPVNNLEAAIEDSSLLSAKERKDLMIFLHTEYMTNVRLNLPNRASMFSNCPGLKDWTTVVKNNRPEKSGQFRCEENETFSKESRRKNKREKKSTDLWRADVQFNAKLPCTYP